MPDGGDKKTQHEGLRGLIGGVGGDLRFGRSACRVFVRAWFCGGRLNHSRGSVFNGNVVGAYYCTTVGLEHADAKKRKRST